jgi:hypothetical protein
MLARLPQNRATPVCAEKINFDGTNPPMVADAPQNHYIWYKLQSDIDRISPEKYGTPSYSLLKSLYCNLRGGR